MKQNIEVKSAKSVKIERPDPSSQQSRSRIYVRDVKGTLEYFRRSFGFILLAMFVLIPWITYDGQQAVLLDIGEQRFRIFGMTLWPQDFTLVAWFSIAAAFALFFVTTLFGRVWCGFMCPQTTWTFIFMWFEKKFEGSRNQRMKLDERKMDFDKFWRKTAKQTAWVTVSLLTALVFVGYFTDIRQLFIDFFTLNWSFWAAGSVIFFAFCTYGNAGYMREIMCTHICPYARFQSVMFDKDTFTVSYDVERGEPRGPRGRKQDPEKLGLGDCIDCNLCVQVCPTGIDIRNGLQYECINCGLCVDACNGVMEKMRYPKGLIRYTTERNLSGKVTRLFRAKSIGYFIGLIAVSTLLVWTVISRVPVDIEVIRDRNQLFHENIQGNIENVYTLKLSNKSQQAQTYELSVEGIENYQLKGETVRQVGAGEVASVPVTVIVPPQQLKEQFTDFNFVIRSQENPDIVERQTTRFIYDPTRFGRF
ncbi:cytochrome c oxidase accessory protein CcoG [Idiomarina tyrosinivorans]|uniref:Cytochrome c oxidase accessory protein CcoG n=1 Tax=Idiomarina tyrosinivorans TaxID=1445662 RepID=A0A432ZSN4_9GAMM|nr:cytochrome c oxidase accessory protein CcoG [Idiomarina tyrosinivorans]RUO80920.1 cytochrome c oxidase accessory protein CcoG [Idiomarina tyrosinivorans]